MAVEVAAGALTSRRAAVAAPLAVLAVALQIAYPLASGTTRDRLIVGIVVAFAAASAASAVATRGWRVGGAAIALAGAVGFAADVIGVHTGVPFGRYEYGTLLGPRLGGVPLVVALAWTMLAWPAAVVARRLVRGTAARVAVGAWALAAWDVYLDPQMVAAGAWHWHAPGSHLPGVTGVPLTDYAGWFAVAVVISAGMQWCLRDDPGGDDAVPVALYLWTWVGSAVALGAFLGHPAAALWGALAMGVVGVPLVRTLTR